MAKCCNSFVVLKSPSGIYANVSASSASIPTEHHMAARSTTTLDVRIVFHAIVSIKVRMHTTAAPPAVPKGCESGQLAKYHKWRDASQNLKVVLEYNRQIARAKKQGVDLEPALATVDLSLQRRQSSSRRVSSPAPHTTSAKDLARGKKRRAVALLQNLIDDVAAASAADVDVHDLLEALRHAARCEVGSRARLQTAHIRARLLPRGRGCDR